MSRSAPRPLSAALAGLTATLSPASTLARVQVAWESAAGAAIAAAASPTAERDGVLTVTCAAAVWAQELELIAPLLLERLNELPRRGYAAQVAVPYGLTVYRLFAGVWAWLRTALGGSLCYCSTDTACAPVHGFERLGFRGFLTS